ncbi:MAG: hypothetical protein ACQESR_29420 [Planctomycetota bacterium]
MTLSRRKLLLGSVALILVMPIFLIGRALHGHLAGRSSFSQWLRTGSPRLVRIRIAYQRHVLNCSDAVALRYLEACFDKAMPYHRYEPDSLDAKIPVGGPQPNITLYFADGEHYTFWSWRFTCMSEAGIVLVMPGERRLDPMLPTHVIVFNEPMPELWRQVVSVLHNADPAALNY